MTNEQIFTPNPDEIKTVAVVDLHGRTQTYSSLLSAMTAVYGLPQAAHRRIEAILKTAVSEEVGDE
jgi:hypothetical protein